MGTEKVSSEMVGDAVWTIVVMSLGIGVGYGAQIILARSLDVNVFGAYQYVASWAWVGGSVATLGLGQACQRFLPEYVRERRWENIRGLERFAVASALTGGLVAGWIMRAGLEGAVDDRYLRWGVKWLVAIVPSVALLYMVSGLLRGWKRVAVGVGLLQLGKPFVNLGVALFVGGMGQKKYIFGIQIIGLVVLIGCGILIVRSVPGRPKGGPVSCEEWGKWLGIGVPLAVVMLLTLAGQQVTQLLMGLWGNARDVAILSVVSRVAVVAMLPQQVTNAVTLPRVRDLLARGEVGRLRRYSRVCFVGSVGTSLLIVAGSGNILQWFGEKFVCVESIRALEIFLLARLVVAYGGTASAVVAMGGGHNMSAGVYAIGLGIAAGSAWWLIPRHGVVGAACGAGAGLVVITCLQVLLARRLTGAWVMA